jgi:hypothetical protein
MCLGVVAGKRLWRDVPGAKPEWGPVKIAVGDASQEAVGLIAAAAATVDYFGRADLSTADLEDPGYQDWLSGLVRATPTTMPAFTEVLATGPSVEDALATTEAELISGLAGYARTPRPTLIYPSPVMTADLVLATVPGRAGERLRDALGDAVKKELPKQGWHVSGGEGAGGKGPVPTAPLPPANGLPDPGVLAALRNAWKAA